MFVTGVGTAVPPWRITQAECWEFIQTTTQFAQLDSRARALLRKVLTGDNGIMTRHAAVADWDEAFMLTPDALHSRFARHAPALATEAARKALATAKLQPEDVDAVLISTCTGYLCPGLTSYVSEQLGLRADVLPLDLVGQGCGAALPNWRMAESLLASGQSRHVLSICVEICSAAFYLDNDPGVLISACLFGDGAAATVLSRQPASHFRRVECVAFQSCLRPNERDSLRFEQRGGMLRNVLSRKVPLLAARQVAKLFQDMMEGRALNRSDVSSWILHAGGRDVLAAVQGHLGLSPDDVQGSAAILRDFGNVSSPFVIFVLAQALCDASPGGWWWMSSFGAGFSCHGALLKVE